MFSPKYVGLWERALQLRYFDKRYARPTAPPRMTRLRFVTASFRYNHYFTLRHYVLRATFAICCLFTVIFRYCFVNAFAICIAMLPGEKLLAIAARQRRYYDAAA